MAYPYQLTQQRNIGPRTERTYEFTAQVPRPAQNAVNGKKGAKKGSQKKQARPMPNNNGYNAYQNARHTPHQMNTPVEPSVKRRQVMSANENEKTYEFEITMPRPAVNPQRKTARRQAGVQSHAGHYVLNKNGRRVYAHTEAQYLAIKKERDEAMKREYKRMLEEAAAARAESSIRTIASKSKTPIPKTFIAGAIVCTLLFMYMIYNMVYINERTRDITELEKELNVLTVRRKELEDELEKKNDLVFIEDYAVNRLGMVKTDRLSRQYISIENEDKIEILSEENVDDTPAKTILHKIKDRLDELWEYIN